MNAALLLILPALVGQADTPIKVEHTDTYVQIETAALQARINKKGYVSGTAQNSLLDKKTGSRDLGFGLHIMDFLLGPGWKDDDYGREPKYHGNLPKHYVEGPQICTQAKQLEPKIIRGEGFVAVTMEFRFTKPANGFKAGSLWRQTLVFLPDTRYYFSSESITSANDVENLLYRIDMPGHIKHKNGDTFEQVYLSYKGAIPAREFATDFPPDGKFLYQRDDAKLPERMIRAYQLKRDGKPGPWIAGMTLDPKATVEAWCHQRSYVCFIQELHGRKVKAGETFGAAYIVGYFDDIASMHATYDRYKGPRSLEIANGKWQLK